MPHASGNEKVFLNIGFRSPEPSGSLKTIEIFGIPGERLKDGQCVVSEKAQHFFDDLIVKKIFRESRRLPDCNFEYLKIWLYDPNKKNEERRFAVPKIDNRDLEIRSNVELSRLERIYVLDNGLKGQEYEVWKRTVMALFTPLFGEFIAPPGSPSEAPSWLANTLGRLVEAADKHTKMKQSLFFNAFIIQID